MVTRSRSAAATLLAAGLLCAPARANDSASELDAGGLVLRREPGSGLSSADLSIARDRITVSYLFRSRVGPHHGPLRNPGLPAGSGPAVLIVLSEARPLGSRQAPQTRGAEPRGPAPGTGPPRGGPMRSGF
jgi:hypothetical protein